MIYQSLLLASGLAATFAQQELLVKTTAGEVQGHYAPQNVREWNGIPYATPPVGDLRWEQSIAHPAWSDPYNADFMAPGCPQVSRTLHVLVLFFWFVKHNFIVNFLKKKSP